MRIALTGNPNSGKTTMFNALTGKNERVGNWAGVTVEKKESTLKRSLYSGSEELIAVDLPGAYSMSPFTSEESITRDYIKTQAPDVIINIVDATNLGRSLFFTTQLLELEIPVVVALNKTDINEKKKNEIDEKELSSLLGCPVIKTVSTRSDGIKEVVEAAQKLKGKHQKAPYSQGSFDLTDKKAVRAADEKRFSFVNGIVKEIEKRSVSTKQRSKQDKIDELFTDKWLGIPVFAVIMYGVFWISQAGPGVWLAEGIELSDGRFIPGLATLLQMFQSWVGGFFTDADPLLYALLVDGVIGGAVAVVGFLPLVMVMYFLIALLEDCGYMARVSVVLDPIFKKVGLSGKSVIPFVSATGCAIPGVMACRTVRTERERRATAMLAPFMPCGAKLPVIALFAGAFFEDAIWVGPLMYFAGIIIIFFSALIINGITGYKAKKSYFIIELPEYKLPSLKSASLSMLSRGKAYIIKAATIILLCNTVVQIMQSFTWQLSVAQSADASILASVAEPFSYLLIPVVGVASWELAAAAITGFIAKENVVGTLAVCFVGLENLIDAEELALMEGAGGEVASAFAITKAAALAYLAFNLFTPPCFAAMGAMNSEMKSAKWLWGAIGFQLGTGFTVAFLVYQVGTLFSSGALGAGFLPGVIAVVIFAAIIGLLIFSANKRARKEDKKKTGLHIG